MALVASSAWVTSSPYGFGFFILAYPFDTDVELSAALSISTPLSITLALSGGRRA
jgi:hypothetical protein